MRTVTTEHEIAITESPTYRALGKLTVYKSRVFFGFDDIVDNSPTYALPAESTSLRVPEVLAYIPDTDKCWSVLVNPNGTIGFFTSGDSTEITASLAGDPPTALATDITCRPGVYGNYLFYFSTTTNRWMIATIDPVALLAGDPGFILSEEDFSTSTSTKGSIYPMSATEAFLCCISYGDIALYYGNTTTLKLWNGRFINPIAAYSNIVNADVWATHYAGAARTTYGDFFYFSDHRGAVRVIRFKNNMWSDTQISIPSDLSKTFVNNVFSFNDNVYMCARFERLEEFSSNLKYTLFTKSTDGFTFSMDRRIVVSSYPMWFYAAMNESTNQVVFSSSNRVYETLAPYQLLAENADSVLLSLVTLEGSPLDGWNVTVKAGGQETFDHAYIKTGSYCKIEVGSTVYLGESMGSDDVYITYHDAILSACSIDLADAQRDQPMQLVSDALWHNQVMTHPFYMEIQGKQAIYDPTKEFNNMYKQSDEESTGVEWPLTVDFFPDAALDNSAYSPQSHAASTASDTWSTSLLTTLTSLPEFGSLAQYKLEIYGWSRPGIPDVQPNVDDPTSTSSPNDDFSPLLTLYNPTTGLESELVIGSEDLTSTYAHPPQTYFAGHERSGSYPVIYTLDNPGEGMQIKKIGVRVTSGGGATVYYLERVEMPEILASYSLAAGIDKITEYNVTPGEAGTVTVDFGSGFGLDSVPPEPPTGTYLVNSQIVSDVANKKLWIVDNFGSTYPTWREYPTTDGITLAQLALVNKVVTTSVGAVYVAYCDPANSDLGFVGRCAKEGDAWATLTAESIKAMFPSMGVGDNLAGVKDIIVNPMFEDVVYVLIGLNSQLRVITFKDGVQVLDDSPVHGADNNGMATLSTDGLYLTMCRPTWHFGPYAGVIVMRGVDPFETLYDYNFFYTRRFVMRAGLTQKVWLYGDDQIDYSEKNFSTLTDGTYTQDNITISGPPVDYTPYALASNSDGSIIVATKANTSGLSYSTDNMTTWQDGTSPLTAIGTRRHFLFLGEAAGACYFSAWANDDISFQIQFTADGGATWSDKSGNLSTIAISKPNITAMASFGLSNYLAYTAGVSPAVSDATGNIVVNTTPGTDSVTTLSTIPGVLRMAAKDKGKPSIMFSSRPYSAFNFEVSARFRLRGQYSTAGVIGLAADKSNYILGYVGIDTIGIAKIRSGIREIIYEVSAPGVITEDQLFEMRFTHRDGTFTIDVKQAGDPWGRRGSQFTYQWKSSTDGAICKDDDIWHVGVYTLIDPPKIRFVGMRSGQTFLPVMPGVRDRNGDPAIGNFPSSGHLMIDGQKYAYTGKTTTITPRGPFQVMNIGVYDSPLNKDPESGFALQGGRGIEFSMFSWLTSSSHYTDYSNALAAVTNQYTWAIQQVLFKAWRLFGGVKALLRDRIRILSTNQPDYYATSNSKGYITFGFSGITLVESTLPEGDEVIHNPGGFAFVDSDDNVTVHGFVAYSGEKDYSIARLLDIFCRISGTQANFYGDTIIPTATIVQDETLELPI